MNHKQQDRLSKILALLDGATTEGEATAAMARAASILDGSGLTLEEFREQFGADADSEPDAIEIVVAKGCLYIPGARGASWKWSAAYTACHAAGVRVAYRRNGTTLLGGQFFQAIVTIGTPEALGAAAQLLQTLLNATFPHAIETFKRGAEYQATSGAARRRLTADFTIGYWSRLRARANLERHERENAGQRRLDDQRRNVFGPQPGALVLASDCVRSRTVALVRVETEHVKASMRLTYSRSTQQITSYDAYEAGRKASESANLSVSQRRAIGA